MLRNLLFVSAGSLVLLFANTGTWCLQSEAPPAIGTCMRHMAVGQSSPELHALVQFCVLSSHVQHIR